MAQIVVLITANVPDDKLAESVELLNSHDVNVVDLILSGRCGHVELDTVEAKPGSPQTNR